MPVAASLPAGDCRLLTAAWWAGCEVPLSLFAWCEKALDRATPDGAVGAMKAADVLADACSASTSIAGMSRVSPVIKALMQQRAPSRHAKWGGTAYRRRAARLEGESHR